MKLGEKLAIILWLDPNGLLLNDELGHWHW